MDNENNYDAPEPEQGTPPEGMDQKGNHGMPQLINSEICPDAQPGETIMLKVLKKHEGELEVSYMGKEGEEGAMPPDGAPEPAMAGGDSMLD